jgi:hypothetical protein
MKTSNISLTSAIGIALTLCFSTLCLSCANHRGMATSRLVLS